MALVSESIFIEASPEKVKQVFYDFKDHKNWNPFFIQFEVPNNPVKVGDELKVVIHPHDKTMTITPKVTEVKDNELVWKGTFMTSMVFYGTHTFQFLEHEQDGKKGTLFINSEQFGGILFYPMKMIGVVSGAIKGFKDMNKAFKEKVESGN
jgi:hypothetical protein